MNDMRYAMIEVKLNVKTIERNNMRLNVVTEPVARQAVYLPV